MRYFKGKFSRDKYPDQIIVYDAGMEYILEKGLSCLLEAKGNAKESAKLFAVSKDEVLRHLHARAKVDFSSKGKDELEKACTHWKLYFDEVHAILDNEDRALEELERLRLVGEKNLEVIREESTIHENVRSGLITVPFMEPANLTRAGLYLTIISGHSVDIDAGLTSGLRHDLHAFLKEVWEIAVKELHPFQRGPTHQGTKHCAQVLDNLYALQTQFSLPWNEDLCAMLSLASALHDVGKGDLLADPPPADVHAQNSANLIRRALPSFKLDKLSRECRDFVAKIIEMHNPEGQLDKINKLQPSVIEDNNLGINSQNVETKNFCALFQLADVMDTRGERVSDSAFEVLSQLHLGNSGYYAIENIVQARKGIVNIIVKTGQPYIGMDISSHHQFGAAARIRIDKENEDLEKTGAKEVLKNNSWPSELKEV